MQRSFSMMLVIVGAAVVTLLLLFRVDVRRATVTGPAWKRRLLAAGLAALGMAASGGCVTCYIPAGVRQIESAHRAEAAAATQPVTLKSLERRVGLLEDAFQARSSRNDVKWRLLSAVERDLAIFETQHSPSTMPADEREMLRDVRSRLAQLRQNLTKAGE